MAKNRDQFAELDPYVSDNADLRIPQREGFTEIQRHFVAGSEQNEIGIVLPVGCGKSGLLALTPFAVKSARALLVAPNLHIARQLLEDVTPSNPNFFYEKRGILSEPPYPEVAEIRGDSTNVDDLAHADLVVTNIQQLQSAENRWLSQLDSDFFDLIMFDEAHHNVAQSWEQLRSAFPEARIVNVSATPARADGRKMAGEIVYSFPIREATELGYIKRVSGHRLNPKSLRYVRRDDNVEVEVGLDEVRELGEKEADFRRSIVSSDESLSTIVDASIRKLRSQRTNSGEDRLKIIASALNMEHCKQIVAKYRERGLRADFVHSKIDSKANADVHAKLERHELDVIVQVRKLGEGFDHPLLSVAAVFSIFSSLSPFVQFVGRVMRIVPDTEPTAPINEGVVVFHVGANITGVWNDFQDFADADQEWLMNLVDETIEGTDIAADDVDPPTSIGRSSSMPTITAQGDVLLENLALLRDNPDVAAAIQVLADAGVSTGDDFEQLRRIQPSRQDARRAKRAQLDDLVKTRVGQLLAEEDVNPQGSELDSARLGRTNFQVAKGSFDRTINLEAERGNNQRNEFSLEELESAINNLDGTTRAVHKELFNGA